MEKLFLNLKNHFTSTLNSDNASNKILTVPNFISFVRIMLIPVYAYFIWKREGQIALSLMVLCGVSDFLDGYIARASKSITKLGKILDPIADRLMIFITLIMLSVVGVLPIYICIAIFLRETMLFFLYGCLILNGREIIPVTMLGKTATAGLIISMPLVYLASFMDFKTLHFIATILLVISVCLYWLAGLVYARKTMNDLHKVGGNNSSKVLISGVVTLIIACMIILFLYFLTPVAVFLKG